MMVVVAEGHGGGRKRRRGWLQENWAGKAGFRQTLRFYFLLRSPAFIGGREPVLFASAPWEQNPAAGRPLGATAKAQLPLVSARRVVGGRPLSSVGGPTACGFGLVDGRAVQTQGWFKEENHLFLSCCRFGGEKKGEQCRSKRHRLGPFFLKNVLDKTRRFI